MTIDHDRTYQLLEDFEFETLFIEELGWDFHTQSFSIQVDGAEYLLAATAQKRGMGVYICTNANDGTIPESSTRQKIERQVARRVHEHLIIFVNDAKTTQIWQWVKREEGERPQYRDEHYHSGQHGEALIQKLAAIAFSLDEERDIGIVDVASRVRAAFDVEKVTKQFYEQFKKEHDAFLQFLDGIPDEGMQRWYVSVILNRLMFIYFIQKKGFLDGDPYYLRTNLRLSQETAQDKYYSAFLCPLFFEGFAKPKNERSQEMSSLIGDVPYLNGGIFQKHQIEEHNGERIQIPDTAFESLFTFFEHYQWHLDDRLDGSDNEINPEVLGYIFEKYINQKQMGAYYTKEDITEYISKNTIIPFLLDSAQKKCKKAFEPPVGGINRVVNGGDRESLPARESSTCDTIASVWQLLVDRPDRYIYASVKKGVKRPLPAAIAVGVNDVSQRNEWNLSALPEYALPTEIWREVVARRGRYKDVRAKLSNGDIHEVNDLITYNLHLRRFTHDIIQNCKSPKLLSAFWNAIKEVTVLDPTCGSGAFLFAALNILEPLYEACLDRMQEFLDELENSVETPHPKKFANFRADLDRIKKHPNRKYFILKSIIINNLYGVDIMEEAIEICKLRLFLKMMAQVDDVNRIEPLPDIDFNIKAGNTLVGFATYDDVKRAVTENRIDFDNVMDDIEEKAEDVDALYKAFQEQQTEYDGDVTLADKQELQGKLNELADELNDCLTGDYDVNTNNDMDYKKWLSSHKPFHWFVEFYGILKRGGFDVIIGNPPYVEYNRVQRTYTVQSPDLMTGGNLHSMTTYRSITLSGQSSYLSLIVPIALSSTDRMMEIRTTLTNIASIWISNFAIRPGKLFTGAEQRLLIFIASRCYKGTFSTTKYVKWNSEERDCLFDCIRYHEWSQSAILRAVWPKFDSITSERILSKVARQDFAIGRCLGNRTSCVLYYKNTGIGYFVVVTRQPPVCYINGERTPSSRETILALDELEMVPVVHCVLNSSLYFLVYQQLSNCRDLNPSDIHLFRMPRSLFREQAFENISEELQRSLEFNSSYQTRNQRQTGQVRIQTFTPSCSKSVIDEIDIILARHYGFTDEELDFIINYDIKYRMGLGND